MNKYTVFTTNKFKRDYKKMKKRNIFDEKEFKKVVQLLANDEILPPKYCNHLLEPKSERNMGITYKTRLAFNVCKKWKYININFNQNRNSFGFIFIVRKACTSESKAFGAYMCILLRKYAQPKDA